MPHQELITFYEIAQKKIGSDKFYGNRGFVIDFFESGAKFLETPYRRYIWE